MICAKGADHVHLRRAAHAGDFRAKRFGDLHREHAHVSISSWSPLVMKPSAAMAGAIFCPASVKSPINATTGVTSTACGPLFPCIDCLSERSDESASGRRGCSTSQRAEDD